MPLLLASARDELWRGDILRLAEDYSLGPGSGPVDLLVYEPHDDECGLGIMTISGAKAGLTWHVLPKESLKPGRRCIDMAWLKRNWDLWFAYEWQGAIRALDIHTTMLLEWDRRTILENA